MSAVGTVVSDVGARRGEARPSRGTAEIQDHPMSSRQEIMITVNRRRLATLVMAVDLTLGLVRGVLAQDMATTHNIMGEGMAPCMVWSEVRVGKQGDRFESWVLGFLSGVATANLDYDPLRGVGAVGVWTWIDNWCQAHPSRLVVDAVTTFADEHRQ
jgi:hypothetical protein